MTGGNPWERLEAAFRRAQYGDRDAFAEWMGMVEHPLRRSLARFARAVDVEVAVQETFLRMWLFASDPQKSLEGENASLRFALAVARNVALEEVHHAHLERFVDLDNLEQLSEGRFTPAMPDPALAKAIADCVGRLPKQPNRALTARIQDGHLPDRELARGVRMKLNTFLQNIVRARRLVAECLEKRGVQAGEILQ
jgi:DNA-directed RNA polymerase specialized sigma24 family protein